MTAPAIMNEPYASRLSDFGSARRRCRGVGSQAQRGVRVTSAQILEVEDGRGEFCRWCRQPETKGRLVFFCHSFAKKVCSSCGRCTKIKIS